MVMELNESMGHHVDVVTEISNLITAQRAYEMNSKAVQTTDQMLQYAAENM